MFYVARHAHRPCLNTITAFDNRNGDYLVIFLYLSIVCSGLFVLISLLPQRIHTTFILLVLQYSLPHLLQTTTKNGSPELYTLSLPCINLLSACSATSTKNLIYA